MELNIEKGKSFYKLVNKAPLGDKHVLARIKPHSRQKIGDEIVLMLEADPSRNWDEHGLLTIVTVGDVHWGDGTSLADGDATLEPNIRIGMDVQSLLVEADDSDGDFFNQYWRTLSVYWTNGWTNAFGITVCMKPKVVKLMWTGTQWISTSPFQVLDMFS